MACESRARLLEAARNRSEIRCSKTLRAADRASRNFSRGFCPTRVGDLTQHVERLVSRRKSRIAGYLEQRLTQLVYGPPATPASYASPSTQRARTSASPPPDHGRERSRYGAYGAKRTQPLAGSR
jgi:hypothetical protein